MNSHCHRVRFDSNIITDKLSIITPFPDQYSRIYFFTKKITLPIGIVLHWNQEVTMASLHPSLGGDRHPRGKEKR